jgi:alpha-beta hydrolase superfamily lysophospholipase
MAAEAAPVAPPAAQPHFFGPAGAERFAWLHPAAESARRGGAVVMCPPFGFEYVCIYQTWRLLAERLAADGLDVLRLDYPGTGNASGSLEDAGLVAAWRDAIAGAVEEIRRLRPGVSVALLGLRLGATLAGESAAALGVERLILWSPLASGRSFVREARALSRLTEGADAEEPAARDAGVAGFALTEATADALKAIDLMRVAAAPAPRALVVERDDLPSDGRLADRLRALGADVTSARPEGTAVALEQRPATPVPHAVFDAIAAWLEDWRPTPRAVSARIATVGVLAGANQRERAIRFGHGERLFGFLAEPAAPRPDGLTVVLLSTGCVHHIGPHRMFPALAREWASRGHAVLRFDLGGIGDSRPPDGAESGVAYPEHALDDIRAALDAVVRAVGRRPVVLAGLCSGGWHAFRAAREGLPVRAIFCVNPQLYFGDAGQSMAALDERSELGRYQRSMADPRKWVKALSGGVSYGAFAALAGAAFRRTLAGGLRAVSGRAQTGELARDLVAIARRDVEAMFVWSPEDLGLQYLRLHAGSVLRRPEVRRRVRVLTVPEGDHTFRSFAAQRRLALELRVFVERLAATRARDSAALPVLRPSLVS